MGQRPTDLGALLIERKSQGVVGGRGVDSRVKQFLNLYAWRSLEIRSSSRLRGRNEISQQHYRGVYGTEKCLGDLVTSATLPLKGKPVSGEKQ